MVSPAHAGDTRFIGVLKPMIGAIPVEVMREANYMVDRDTDKASPDEAARWIERRIGPR
jgi:osmoprotectant transport system permease protein